MLKILVLATVFFLSRAEAADYCLALRGNGEAQPAHWGALANVVEKLGLPIAQSGGSSATISMFLLDSLASNSLISRVEEVRKPARAALLLKSLYGIASYIGQTPQARAGLDLMATYQSVQSFAGQRDVLKKLTSNLSLAPSEIQRLRSLARNLQEAGFAQSPRYSKWIASLQAFAQNPSSLSERDRRELIFYAREIRDAISVIGAFDAEGDPALFFRDGLIDFRAFALSVGKIGTFLARTDFSRFFTRCERSHLGLTWQELNARDPGCQAELNTLLREFFAKSEEGFNVIYRTAGAEIASFPTTAVLRRSAYEEARRTYEAYHSQLDRSYADRFRIQDLNDVLFGYWGRPDQLERIERNLVRDFADDPKSSRFLGLGSASWLDVLSFSPAEPGLASVQKMRVNGEPGYSIGGWSDLHPVPVLKALGCPQVVYVTRRGGESLFGQGVAKRIFQFDRGWESLWTKPPDVARANDLKNDQGDPADLSSLWGRMYNVANPQSSYMLSVAKADAVLCTDWNAFDVKSQMQELVTESYRAPYFVRRADLGRDLKRGGARFLTIESQSPKWVGCH